MLFPHTLGLILARIKIGTLRMGEGVSVVIRSERQKSRGASEVDSRVFWAWMQPARRSKE